MALIGQQLLSYFTRESTYSLQSYEGAGERFCAANV